MCAHQLGQSTQNGQQVKASRDRVNASRRDTKAVLKPTAKGSDSTNSSSSQLLSCQIHMTCLSQIKLIVIIAKHVSKQCWSFVYCSHVNLVANVLTDGDLSIAVYWIYIDRG